MNCLLDHIKDYFVHESNQWGTTLQRNIITIGWACVQKDPCIYILNSNPRLHLCSLQWCHHVRDVISNHQPHDCLLNRLFRRRSKKTSKLHINGLCVGNSPVTGEFPTQRANNTENISFWWRHHVHKNYTVMIQLVFIQKSNSNKKVCS